jgi:hypothetical protein
MDLFTQSGREAAAADPEWAGAADLHAYVKALLNWRKGKEVIHSGKTMHFIPQDNTYAYFRYNDTDLVFVFINNSDKDVKLTWSRFAEINADLSEGRDVVTGDVVTLSDDTVVPANTALVIEYTR